MRTRKKLESSETFQMTWNDHKMEFARSLITKWKTLGVSSNLDFLENSSRSVRHLPPRISFAPTCIACLRRERGFIPTLLHTAVTTTYMYVGTSYVLDSRVVHDMCLIIGVMA